MLIPPRVFIRGVGVFVSQIAPGVFVWWGGSPAIFPEGEGAAYFPMYLFMWCSSRFSNPSLIALVIPSLALPLTICGRDSVLIASTSERRGLLRWKGMYVEPVGMSITGEWLLFLAPSLRKFLPSSRRCFLVSFLTLPSVAFWPRMICAFSV